jgi:hypothetical protein
MESSNWCPACINIDKCASIEPLANHDSDGLLS